MNELTDAQLWLGLGGAGVVLALLQVIKWVWVPSEAVASRFIPVLALVLGILWNWLVLRLVRAPDMRWEVVLYLGLFTGLSASGAWSGAKATLEGVSRIRGG